MRSSSMQRSSSSCGGADQQGPPAHRVEQRNAQVVHDGQAHEGPRQLEAARQPQVRAPVRRHAVEQVAGEMHRARLVVQRAAHAIDERALARAVGADEAEALALLDVQVDAVERHEAAEAFGQALYLEQWVHAATGRSAICRSYNSFTPLFCRYQMAAAAMAMAIAHNLTLSDMRSSEMCVTANTIDKTRAMVVSSGAQL